MRAQAVKHYKFALLLSAVVLLAAGLLVFVLSSSSLGNSDTGPEVEMTGSTEACDTAEEADEPDELKELDEPGGQEGQVTDTAVMNTSKMTAGTRYIQVAGKQYIIGSIESSAGFSIENGSDIYRYDIGEAGTVIVSDCIADVNGDGTDEILLITGGAGQEYGSDFWILWLEMTDGAVSVSDTDRISLKAYNPWKVQTCDVDGDGTLEVSFGVYKTSRFHPVMAKRPFIYDLHENGISPKWRGSRLSRPFDDYIFSDINSDGADEIVSIEHLADGRKAVNSYVWKGFGFEGIGESGAYDDILSIRESESESEGMQTIEACVIVDGQEQWIKLYHDNDALSVAEDR